jgi:hypothetical protein
LSAEPLEQTAEQFDRSRMGAIAASFLVVLIAGYMLAILRGNDITLLQAVTLRIAVIVSATGLAAFAGATLLTVPIENGLGKAAFFICVVTAGAVSNFALPIKTRESVPIKTEDRVQPPTIVIPEPEPSVVPKPKPPADPGNASRQRDLAVSYNKSATCWLRRAICRRR